MRLDHLIERDVDDIYVPSTIYGVGGGGREAVLQMFEQDWFAIEVMRNQDGTTNVFLVDTTVNEGGINERIERRQSELNELRDRMRETLDDQQIGGINFEPVEITRNIKTDRASTLTGDGSVPAIKQTTNIDQWWLDRQDLVEPGTNDLYDFSKGACRCRAIGKAFHYKALAEAEDRGYNLHYERPGNDDKVAIFAGLGGGTGSGVFMDIAKQLYEQHQARRITLFATLPTRKEQVKERANAFAALSELEYQSFAEEDDLFDNVVLFPLQPLDPDIAVTDQELLELDQAMTYALIGYYNAGMYDDAVNQSPSYAPFTIALPQVFRYDIQGIVEAKDNAIETINRKIDALNAEREIYDELTAYVEEHYETHGDAELKRVDEDLLRRRIQFMRELVELPLFDELEFDKAVETGERLLDTIYDVDEDEGESYSTKSLDVAFAENDLDALLRRDLGFHFEYEYQDVDVGSDLNELDELDDESIQRVIIAESARLKHKFETLEAIRTVPSADSGDEAIAKLLRYMLNPTVEADESARVNAVQKHLDDVRSELESVQAELDGVTDEIESELSVQETLVQSQVDNWETTVSGDLKQLAELEAVDVETDVEQLRSALEQFAMALQQGRTPPSGESVQAALDAIRAKLEPIDAVDFEPKYDELLQQVDLAKQLREDWNTYLEAQNRGLSDKLNPFSDTPDEGSARKILKSTIVNMSERVFTTSHLGPNQTQLEIDVTYDPYDDGAILDEIRTQRRRIRADVVDEYRTRMRQIAEEEGDGSFDTGFVEQFESRLDAVSSPSALRREREDLVAHVEKTYKETASEELPELEARQSELSAEVAELEETVEKYDRVLELYKDLRERQEVFTSKHEAFNEDINQQADRFGTRAFAEYQPNQHYIHKYMPQDTRRAIEKQSLAETDLFQKDWSQNERSRIRDFSNEVVKRRVSAPDYVGLRERDFGNQDYDFSGTRVHVAKISEAIDPSSSDKARLWIEDIDVQESLNENYYLDEPGEQRRMFEQWATRNGGPWDVALTFFVQGLGFLDNLRDVVENRGYRDGYEARKREIHNIGLHHSYGLERGFYVRRSEFSDPRDPTERELFLNADGNDIRKQLTEYLELVPTTDDVDVERGPPTPVTYRDDGFDGTTVAPDGTRTSAGSGDDEDDDEMMIEETDGGRSRDERTDGGGPNADASDGERDTDASTSDTDGGAGDADEPRGDRGS